ncbi:hypothetical protein SISSUDRAFT_992856, partial [Sistotremastrum suecicum HHB10207 ss-3]
MPAHRKTKPVRILQLNTNRSSEICHALLNTAVNDFDILIIQEPWWGTIGVGPIDVDKILGPTSHPAWQPILPIQPVPNGLAPRVLTYVKKRGDFTVTLRSDLAKSLDLQIIEIHQKPHPPVLVVNMYNQSTHSVDSLKAAETLVRLTLPVDQPVLVTGDMNLHHTDWEDMESAPNQEAEIFVAWTEEAGLTLMNEWD